MGYRGSFDVHGRKMFYKGEFFIEEPQTKFMRAIAGLLMTKAEKKYTLVKKNERGEFSSKIRGQG